jgi:hypothetical protein
MLHITQTLAVLVPLAETLFCRKLSAHARTVIRGLPSMGTSQAHHITARSGSSQAVLLTKSCTTRMPFR